MRRGEKYLFAGLGLLAILLLGFRSWQVSTDVGVDPGLPFYTTADVALSDAAALLIRKQKCKDCHSLWANRDMTQNVPAPRLDGMGTLKTEQWLYDYFSATDPQGILSSRLKPRYRMPSFAHLEEKDRRVLAKYVASLKVKDWYLDEVKSHEYEKLTGKKIKSQTKVN